MTTGSEHQTKNVSFLAHSSLLKTGGEGIRPWSLKKPVGELGSSFHCRPLLVLCTFLPGMIMLPCLNLSSTRTPKQRSLDHCKMDAIELS